MDGPGHLLSLKVMRVSRPSIASAWQPFYSSSPSFSAHSTTSITSLQGKTPLPGHPKTLRDLTHATELLTLPSSFGAIQLGETFASCLCVNNEANVDIEAVTLKVEMQTVTAKVQLAEFGGSTFSLAAGETLENVVQHEIKELGQHVLACTVTYRLPANARHVPGPAEDVSDPALQTFRKFYKFAVTNPLSVKTKVHAPRSPSALLSASEREKIFLEVHIQNLTQEPLWFERMRLEPVDGWEVVDQNLFDANTESSEEEKESIFTGSTALMQPQDMRQYVYTMIPTSIPTFLVVPTPGSVIALGRLDISWRASFGEPGRLLTSMLSRRIPLPPPVAAASAVPPYLQRGSTVPSNTPPRPGSPQHAHTPSRPGTPPIRPGSRTGTPSISTRPQSPGPVAASMGHPSAATSQVALNTLVKPLDLEVDLVVRDIPHDNIFIEKPFTISGTVRVAASVPRGTLQERVVSLVIQHVQPQLGLPISSPEPAGPPEVFSPRLPSAIVSPSPTMTPRRGHFSYERPFVTSPEHHIEDTIRPGDEMHRNGGVALPPPFADDHEDGKLSKSKGVLFLGSSAIFLDPIRLSSPAPEGSESTDNEPDPSMRVEGSQDFELSFIPLVKGFSTVGGLRVILIEDRIIDQSEKVSNDGDGGLFGTGVRRQVDVRVLKEWDVIGEIWVQS